MLGRRVAFPTLPPVRSNCDKKPDELRCVHSRFVERSRRRPTAVARPLSNWHITSAVGLPSSVHRWLGTCRLLSCWRILHARLGGRV